MIFYPGSPHALSSKEQGIHGAVLLEVSSPGDIIATDVSFSPVRYETLEVNVTGITDKGAFRTLFINALTTNAYSNLQGTDDVLYLVYNTRITGEHNNLTEIQDWTSDLTEQVEIDLPSGAKILVRKVSIEVRPAVEDLGSLAKQSSPVGILANLILLISKGETNEIVDDLMTKMKAKIQELNIAPVYQPLRPEEKVVPASQEAIKSLLLKECNKMLSTLLAQTR